MSDHWYNFLTMVRPCRCSSVIWSSLAPVLHKPIHACTCAKKWNTSYCECESPWTQFYTHRGVNQVSHSDKVSTTILKYEVRTYDLFRFPEHGSMRWWKTLNHLTLFLIWVSSTKYHRLLLATTCKLETRLSLLLYHHSVRVEVALFCTTTLEKKVCVSFR